MSDPEALRRSLGLKPRRPAAPPEGRAPARTARPSASAADADPDEKSEPITDPTKKPTGKLPVDAQRLLRTWYMSRAEVDLPPHLQHLEGTWGRYMGDGRPDREVQVGFRPAFVLFTVPLYPNGFPKWVAKKGNKVEGELVDPGLHDQPALTERGFIAPEACNKVNEATIFIAWKADVDAAPAPIEQTAAATDESPRDARRRAQLEKRKKDLEERRKRAAARRR